MKITGDVKPRSSSKRVRGLTLTEVLVVVAVVALIAAVLLPALARRNRKVSRINCINNVKQVSLSFHLWSEDNNGKFPMQVSVTNGGTMELVESGLAYVHFQVMSNELSTPKLLVCCEEAGRTAATNFSTDFNDSHVSYFVGVDAELARSTMFLAGDANLEVGGVPAKHRLLKLWTNSPVAWIKPRHNGRGNIVSADGHAEQVNTERLRQALKETGVATNRLAIP